MQEPTFALDTLTIVWHDGTAQVLPLPHIFEGSWEELQDTFGPDLADVADGWEPLTGWAGRHGAKGSPVMHPSEFEGERMREYMLARPGYWAVVALSLDAGAVFFKPFLK